MIKIVLTASPMWISRLIRYLTGGRVSHCMLQYPSDLWGGEWVAEATVGGVQKRPAELRRHHVKYEFLCKFDPKPALHTLRDEIGQPYDYPGIVAFAWVILLLRVFKKRVKWPWKNSKAQFCSELIWRFFIAAGIPGAADRDPETVTPEDVLIFMEEKSEFERCTL
jgi:hypothetical protein